MYTLIYSIILIYDLYLKINKRERSMISAIYNFRCKTMISSERENYIFGKSDPHPIVTATAIQWSGKERTEIN